MLNLYIKRNKVKYFSNFPRKKGISYFENYKFILK